MGTKKIGDLITDNMGVYEGKTKLSFGKLVLLGMLAGAFIAIGASSSSAAVYGISNTGLAKSLAGAIFPVGLMFVVLIGAELFTGDCLMSFAVFDKRIRLLDMIRVLAVVFITNLIGACIVVVLVNRCGQLDYGNGALAAATIKTAYNKMNLSFMKAFTCVTSLYVWQCFWQVYVRMRLERSSHVSSQFGRLLLQAMSTAWQICITFLPDFLQSTVRHTTMRQSWQA